jgi:hypothetical protein
LYRRSPERRESRREYKMWMVTRVTWKLAALIG